MRSGDDETGPDSDDGAAAIYFGELLGDLDHNLFSKEEGKEEGKEEQTRRFLYLLKLICT
jgi:hypothetical protein